MIGLDTNVAIRFITQDDKKQAAKANKLFEERLSNVNPGFISLVVLVEISWVLESCYQLNNEEILDVLSGILTTKQLVVESSEAVYLAIRRCKLAISSDFSDALIAVISEHAGCAETVTFDKKAQKVGMILL